MTRFQIQSLIIVAGLISGCSPTGPSRARLELIEFTPDDTNANKTETIFSYFESGFVDKIEYEVDGDERWEQLFNCDDQDQLESTELKIEGDVSYSVEQTYTTPSAGGGIRTRTCFHGRF